MTTQPVEASEAPSSYQYQLPSTWFQPLVCSGAMRPASAAGLLRGSLGAGGRLLGVSPGLGCGQACVGVRAGRGKLRVGLRAVCGQLGARAVDRLRHGVRGIGHTLERGREVVGGLDGLGGLGNHGVTRNVINHRVLLGIARDGGRGALERRDKIVRSQALRLFRIRNGCSVQDGRDGDVLLGKASAPSARATAPPVPRTSAPASASVASTAPARSLTMSLPFLTRGVRGTPRQ